MYRSLFEFGTIFEMDLNLFVAFFFFVALGNLVNAQFYDVTRSISYAGQSLTITHPTSSRSTRYLITAPAETFIQASCSITTTCSRHVFSISRAGEVDLSDEATYCGVGNLPFTNSIGNEIVVALNNGNNSPGSFTCQFTSVAFSNANCDCGWSANTKIVGGVNTGVNEFISHAGLVDTSTNQIYCGAIIISQFWSATAAHCIDAQPYTSRVNLKVGDWDVTTNSDTKWARNYAVAQFIKHPSYRADGNVNDFALVRTVNYVKFNYAVGPACLPYTFNQLPMVGYFLTAVGWGTTSFAGPTSSVLKKADLRVISNTDCNKSYPNQIDVTKICTFGDRVRDTCGMDSGGGLYYRYGSGPRYAIALVNYGQYCASNAPSVNSRLDRYIGWIETTTRVFYCRKT